MINLNSAALTTELDLPGYPRLYMQKLQLPTEVIERFK